MGAILFMVPVVDEFLVPKYEKTNDWGFFPSAHPATLAKPFNNPSLSESNVIEREGSLWLSLFIEHVMSRMGSGF